MRSGFRSERGFVRLCSPRARMNIKAWTKSSPILLVLWALLGFGLAGVTLFFLVPHMRKLARHQREENRVLFFPGSLSDHVNEQLKDDSVKALVKLLGGAKQSLDVCVFAISSRQLVDILISAHQRGVVVRVVTDGDQLKCNGVQIQQLRRAGIQVRHNTTSLLMHHKFAIVDRTLLINGSLNWTLQALHGNQENVLVTTKQSLVAPFVEQFQHLWDIYNPEELNSHS